MADLSDPIDRLEAALRAVNEIEANNIIDDAMGQMTPLECAERLITPVLRRLGTGWVDGDVSLSQVYMGGRICEKALERLLPEAKQTYRVRPKVAIAILEDYHNLGARLLLSVLRASGIDPIYYDHQTVTSLISKAKADGIEVLLVSTLMYRSALKVRDLRKEMVKMSISPVLMVGGAPFLFDEELWRVVGADEMGKDTSAAVKAVNRMSEVKV
ncbi:MAG: cobalamin-dependent protein [Methanomassiliicoccales archaeon]|nr:cobalamin-dependent protein [Methanomassiliicoccales archaeon]